MTITTNHPLFVVLLMCILKGPITNTRSAVKLAVNKMYRTDAQCNYFPIVPVTRQVGGEL